MELTWFGLSCFRIVERGFATIVTDPYGSGLGLPALKIRGDVVTISHSASGHSHTGAMIGNYRELRGPGEYEIGGAFITGIATTDEAITTENVLFLFDFDGLTIAHLGDMSKVPTQTQIEALEQVNVLLVPVGGGSSLNAAQAAELVSMLEPSIVIPMHYHIPRLNLSLENVERFLKEMGAAEPESLPSLKVSSSTLPVETQMVLLQPKLKEG